jgi:pheromone shutdown protein TraB
MFDRHDPRTDGTHVRRLSGGDGTGDVLIAGVVHDHPASAHRVRAVVDATDPDVLALELPPLAVPLFERYAGEGSVPASGEEMSVGVRAASTDDVVGIDGPSSGFLARLARNLVRAETSLSTACTVLASVLSVSKHAVACRVAALLDAPTAVRLAVDAPVEHDVDEGDDPERQAADEQVQIRRARAVLSAFGKAEPVELRDETREAHMAERLASLRERGDVVAVVGVDHLDGLVAHLA